MRVIRHVVVRGRVQGVSFRAFVEREALRLGVEGWVRNRADRSVEAVFAGTSKMIDQMVAACRRGPVYARVDALEDNAATEADLNLRLPGELFSVLSTL